MEWLNGLSTTFLAPSTAWKSAVNIGWSAGLLFCAVESDRVFAACQKESAVIWRASFLKGTGTERLSQYPFSLTSNAALVYTADARSSLATRCCRARDRKKSGPPSLAR